MDTTNARGFLRGGTPQKLSCWDVAQKVHASEQSFPQSQQLCEIGILPALHGTAKMRTRRRAFLLQATKIYLRNRDSAHGEARRFFASGNGIASPTLPAICGSASPDRIA